MGHGSERPDQYRHDETATRPDAVKNFPGKRLADSVGNLERDVDACELQIGEPELCRNHRRQHRDRAPIDKINERYQKEQASDPPAHSTHRCLR